MNAAGAVPFGGVDGQRHLLVEIADGLERTVAVSEQDLHVAQGVADEQVGIAVTIQVGDGQAVGLETHVDLGGREEATLRRCCVDEEPVGRQNGQPGGAGGAKVEGPHHQRVGRRREDRRVRETAVARAGELAERVRAWVQGDD